MLYKGKLDQDCESFWRFKCTKILQLMNLHVKRRVRLILAFSFHHYKHQTLKSKLASLSQTTQLHLRGGYLTLDPDKQNSDTNSLGNNIITIDGRGTPKMAVEDGPQVGSGRSSSKNMLTNGVRRKS